MFFNRLKGKLFLGKITKVKALRGAEGVAVQSRSAEGVSERVFGGQPDSLKGQDGISWCVSVYLPAGGPSI